MLHLRTAETERGRKPRPSGGQNDPSACGVEKLCDLGVYSGHDDLVEKRDQSSHEQSADNNGDNDFYRCVNVSLSGGVERLCPECESLLPCRLAESESLESELVSDILLLLFDFESYPYIFLNKDVLD